MKKYHYINNDFTGTRPFTEADLKDYVKKYSNHNVKEMKVKISPGVKNLLQILQLTATIQDVRKVESLMWVSGAEKILHELSRRTGVVFEDILNASWTEVIEGRVDISELKKRISRSVFHWHSNGETIYVNNEADAIKKEYKKIIVGVTDDLKELRGSPASSGIAKGKASVVFDVSQFAKVKDGDILVAVMTRPEYLPVMHLAAAFVTDEGGITSHAAIIAREMKKPCVIGTRIGSKVIKDGDLLEVDANIGVVKIIKRI